MCFVTRLDCQVCKVKDRYLFHPCESFLEEHVHLEDKSPLPPGKHFHCPELAWPLPEGEDTSHHICDLCLRNGILYYQRTVAIEQDTQFNERHYRLMYPAVEQPPPTPNSLSDEEDCYDVDDETEGMALMSLEKRKAPSELHEARLFPRANEIEGRFPPNWSGLSQRFKRLIRNMYCKEKERQLDLMFPVNKEQKFEEHWQPRLVDEPYRTLTLWVPCCPICKKPSFNANGGIDGVEFEPTAVFWKWLKRLLEGEKMMVTRIKTGFIYKPCDACIQMEVELRRKVVDFLGTCSNPGAWGIWYWLMMRGTSWVQFWNHEAPSIGLPDSPPWASKYFLQLMASGWKAKSGIAWDDTVELNPPVSCPVTAYLHPNPFLDLSQWNKLAGVAGRPDPVVQPPTLATQARMLPYKEANLLLENSRDGLRQESPANASPTVRIPDCPETPTAELRTLRQWNAKQKGKFVFSLDKYPVQEKKRFLTVLGAIIDENGLAVKALERARALAAQQQEAPEEETIAPVPTPPTSQPTMANGDATDSARPTLKRKASGDLPGPETNRARLEEGSTDIYPTPPALASQEGLPHDHVSLGTPEPTNPNESLDDVAQDDDASDDDVDLFGDKGIGLELERSPSANGTAAALVEDQSGEEDAEEVDEPAESGNPGEDTEEVADPEPGNPTEEIFSQCSSGYCYVDGVAAKDRWSFALGVQDEDDEDECAY